jgi:V/A-type H+-transporting ATPase subunit I
MAIARMARVTLCGLLPEKAAVLDAVQALGAMHLIPLRTPDPLAPEDPAQRRRADTAFRHLVEAPEKLTPYRLGKPFDPEAVIGSIIANRLELRRLHDRSDELDMLIEGLAPWGEFTLPPPAQTGGEQLWLYALPVKQRVALAGVDLPWSIVGGTPGMLHVVVIAKDEPPRTLLPVSRVDTGGASLAALRDEREELDIAIEKAARERADLTRWRVILGTRLAAAEDADDRRAAATQTLDADAVFAVQGWVPVDREADLRALAARDRLALLIEPPTAQDMPPTLFRPGSDGEAMGGDLTRFYTSPGYRSWDPSFIVFVSFAIFFAMIMADAGYALLIATLTALYWKKMGASGSGRRMRTMLVALAAASLAYGVAAGSYFGFAPPEGGMLARLAVIDVTDFEKMMRVSILIGALHISIALGAVAWLNKGRGAGLAALGWITVIAGGLLLWLGAGEGTRQAAIWMLVGGLAVVFIGSAAVRPAGSSAVGRLGDGFLALTGATKLFGDLLSYLRLFALGLASASLAGTFNQLAMDLHATRPGIGLLLAIVVFIFGHGINLLIGLMSGVVHGLRLNYIEFFGWGLTAEGYPFRAFEKRETPA